jgi:predicted esterase YcpF (UPF0227 family)
MIIYIHGFGSSGKGGKSLQFREYFKSQNIPCIAPSLSYVPALAIDTLEQLITSYDEEVTLIGSSLGGFYSIYLAEKYGLKAVLINPAIDSSKTLKRMLTLGGTAKNYYDNTRFDWNAKHVDMLLDYRVKEAKKGEYFLLLQTADDVLDYKEALAKLPNAKSIVEEGGTHPFVRIERHFESVKEFLLDT